MKQNGAYYELIRRAEDAIGFGNYDDAVEALSEAKIIYDTRVEAYLNMIPFDIQSSEDSERYANMYYIMGNASYDTEDYPNARKFLEYALQYYEKNGLYYRDYAITLAKLGQIEEAQEQLDKGIELGITQDSIYMAEGEIAHVKGQYKEAAEYLEQAIILTEDSSMKKRALLLCSDVYRSMGSETADKEVTLLEQNLDQFEGGDRMALEERLAGAYVRMAQADEANANEYYEKALTQFQSVYDSGYITYQLRQNIAILYENMDMLDVMIQELRDGGWL